MTMMILMTSLSREKKAGCFGFDMVVSVAIYTINFIFNVAIFIMR